MLPLKIDSPVPVFIVHWNRPGECLHTVQCFLNQELPLRISILDNASELSQFQWGAIVVNPGSWTPRPKLSYLFARNTLLLALTYGGWIHAVVRALLMSINTFRVLLHTFAQRSGFYPIARLLGIRDFLLRRYGFPPL